MNTTIENGKNGKTHVSDSDVTTASPTCRKRPGTTVAASLDAALQTNSLKKFVQTLRRHGVTFDIQGEPALGRTGNRSTSLRRFGRRDEFFAALARWDKREYGNSLTLPEWELLELRLKTIDRLDRDVPRAWFDRAFAVVSRLRFGSLECLVDVVQADCREGGVGALLNLAEAIIRERENYHKTSRYPMWPLKEPARFSVASDHGEPISGSADEWRQVIAAIEVSEVCEPSDRLGVRTRPDGCVELYVPSKLPGEKDVFLIPVDRIDLWVQMTEAFLTPPQVKTPHDLAQPLTPMERTK